MRVVVNGIRLASAGGLRVGINILKNLDKIANKKDQVIFLCPEENYVDVSVRKVNKIYLPKDHSASYKWILGQRWVRMLLEENKPDIVFNLCNIPIKTSIPQLLLIHWPYAVFDEDYIWKEMPTIDYTKRLLRWYLIKINYDYVDHLTVQTQTMQKRAQNNFLGQKKISVIPSSIDLEINSDSSVKSFHSTPKTFLYLSSYYYHKNHKILLDVAKLIKKRGLPFRIQVTIDKNNSDAKNFLSDISECELHDQIINLGSIPQENIDEVFNQAYASINPSFLESFGLTYLEAASKNKLILASDLDFVRETMLDAAIYFDPFAAESILEAMERSTDEALYKSKVEKGRRIVQQWPSWYDVTKRYWELMENILEQRVN